MSWQRIYYGQGGTQVSHDKRKILERSNSGSLNDHRHPHVLGEILSSFCKLQYFNACICLLGCFQETNLYVSLSFILHYCMPEQWYIQMCNNYRTPINNTYGCTYRIEVAAVSSDSALVQGSKWKGPTDTRLQGCVARDFQSHLLRRRTTIHLVHGISQNHAMFIWRRLSTLRC